MFKVNSRNNRRRCDMSKVMFHMFFSVDRVSRYKFQTKMYLFKVDNIEATKRCEIYPKLTMETPEQSQ